MEGQTSIAGQILGLYDRGYAPKEISLQLKLSLKRVRSTLRQATNRGLDSRRLFEVHEMCMEMLSLLRELVAQKRHNAVPARMRALEKQGLPQMLGAAIERRGATEPAATDTRS